MFFFLILHGFYNNFVNTQRLLAYILEISKKIVSFNMQDYKLICKTFLVLNNLFLFALERLNLRDSWIKLCLFVGLLFFIFLVLYIFILYFLMLFIHVLLPTCIPFML
jgi:hypothetical protein